jgi:hypothetical protein
MKFWISTSRILRLGGMFLASAVFVCLCPATVMASCGDYVMVGSTGAHQHHSQAWSQHSGRESGAIHALQNLPGPMQTPSKTPCQGPNCSRRPSIPPLGPTSGPRVTLEHWAILSGELLATLTDDIAGPLTNPEIGFAISNSSRIFRPPR